VSAVTINDGFNQRSLASVVRQVKLNFVAETHVLEEPGVNVVVKQQFHYLSVAFLGS